MPVKKCAKSGKVKTQKCKTPTTELMIRDSVFLEWWHISTDNDRLNFANLVYICITFEKAYHILKEMSGKVVV